MLSKSLSQRGKKRGFLQCRLGQDPAIFLVTVIHVVSQSTYNLVNIYFVTGACLCCGSRREYQCLYGNHFSSGDRETQQHPTVRLGCITAFRCNNMAGGICIRLHIKPRTSVSEFALRTPLPFCSLFFLLLLHDFKTARVIFLTLMPFAIASCQSLAKHSFL